MELKVIARFHSPFESKFGIPKQAGLVEQLEGEIVFEPDYRSQDALRGMGEFDYLWLIWGFSANKHAATSPVVRPPVLGGNEKVGVWATRSPFRPNALGLSSVRIDRISLDTPQGPVIHVKGADLMDGTPIYDIKPYIVYADSHAEARSGFVDYRKWKRLEVVIPDDVAVHLQQQGLNLKGQETLKDVLAQDPRPHYQHDADKVYGMKYDGLDIHFRVDGNTLTVQK